MESVPPLEGDRDPSAFKCAITILESPKTHRTEAYRSKLTAGRDGPILRPLGLPRWIIRRIAKSWSGYGVHLGDVVESDGDISGDAVNVASRIEPLAEGGGVCLLAKVYDHVENKFELPLKSLGSKALKNVSSQVEVYKMVMPWELAVGSSSAPSDLHRVAVMPLVNMISDPNDEYFADGMTEEPSQPSRRCAV